jgi:hypothetical protein
MKKETSFLPDEMHLAKLLWLSLTQSQSAQLESLIASSGIRVATSDVQLLDGKWYVTHCGLLRVARNNRCSGIHTEAVSEFCDPFAKHWVITATVFKTPRSKGFVGYGDANPSNVSQLVRGAELRIAETRAVNRALRKAYGIGICSVEELGRDNDEGKRSQTENSTARLSTSTQLSLRDRLLLLIRQYHLDSNQVKLCALNFCGTATLREADREQIEHFVEHLNTLAAQGREQLVAEINTKVGVKPTAVTEHDQDAANDHKKEAA